MGMTRCHERQQKNGDGNPEHRPYGNPRAALDPTSFLGFERSRASKGCHCGEQLPIV
jgi:hypothetical protein